MEGPGSRHIGLAFMIVVSVVWAYRVPADAWVILAIYPSLLIYASMVQGHERPWTLACQSFIAGNILFRFAVTVVYWLVVWSTRAPFWLAKWFPWL